MSTSSYAGLSKTVGSTPFIGQWISGIMEMIGEQNDRDRYNAAINDYDRYVNDPEFSKQLYQFGEFNPSLYSNPESAQYQQVSMPDGTRESQLSALQKMRDMGEGYGFAQNEAMQNQAIMNANQSAKSSRDAAMMNAKARGVGGSGIAMALGQQGAQNAANLAMMGGLQGAQNAALQRLQSANDYSQGLGHLRDQDTDLSARNADIINRFNMFNTAARNSANQRNTDIRNEAGMFNTNGRNQQQMWNIGRGDRNSMDLANFRLNRQNAKSSLINQMLGGGDMGYKNAADGAGQQRGEFYQMMKKNPYSSGSGGEGFGGMGDFGGMGGEEGMSFFA